jgi:hypothetical protein
MHAKMQSSFITRGDHIRDSLLPQYMNIILIKITYASLHGGQTEYIIKSGLWHMFYRIQSVNSRQ